MKLLTMAHQNAKTAKNRSHTNYLSTILHLAPFTLSGFNTCKAASNGCSMACLNTAGRGKLDNVQKARIRKTKLLFNHKAMFFQLLIKDIESLIKKASKEGKKPVIRLNGTSDIPWETLLVNGKNIFELFPVVQFYDYTKIITRLDTVKKYFNYHLTFSASEINHKAIQVALSKGFNVAMVFDSIPKEYEGIEVLDGDNHDLRFLEGYQGKYIGLKAKGKAKKDDSGFVRKVTNTIEKAI